MGKKILCKECYLRYSSYCVGCDHVVYGINGDHPAHEEIMKTEKAMAEWKAGNKKEGQDINESNVHR